MRFNQYIINTMAENIAENQTEYETVVVVYTWMAHTRGTQINRLTFDNTIKNLTGDGCLPFHSVSAVLPVLSINWVRNTFIKTGEYNDVTNIIFTTKYTVKQRYNYIIAASNISPIQRIECKLQSKHISLNTNIVPVSEDTPLIQWNNHIITFPYEEKGAQTWQIGKQQKQLVEGEVMLND